MLVFFQGRFISESKARVSIFDRSLLYGDGLFETLRVVDGRPFRWQQHLERLRAGAALLGLNLPLGKNELALAAAELLRRTAMPNALLRITLSRGVGPRGYSPLGANDPWLSLSLHPAPPFERKGPRRWELITSSLRLQPGDVLSSHKTANKLRQVLSRAEAEAKGADEALLLNSRGAVAEASSANVFWIEQCTLCTPPLSSGALPGITRGVIGEIARQLGLALRERRCPPNAIRKASGVFLSLTSQGIVEATALDGKGLARSPLTGRLYTAYQELVLKETRSEQPAGWPCSAPGAARNVIRRARNRTV